MPKKQVVVETAETLAKKQREISVSEFFLKNRHLLGFDSPRKAMLTAVKEAVDNALDACEEAGIVPEISVDILQTAENRFRMSVTDNGPGIVRAQIPSIFAKLLYGSKFHRLRMSRGQQGIGISAAGMYGQLTTGNSTKILSRTKGGKQAHYIEVQIDTRQNKPAILKDDQVDWCPEFTTLKEGGGEDKIVYNHGTCVAIDMEAAYVRGKLSIDEFLKQCAVVNPHLQLHYRIQLKKKEEPKPAGEADAPVKKRAKADDEEQVVAESEAGLWITYPRLTKELPNPPIEIKPHPHGVELGMLMQMLKDTNAKTVRAMLCEDFSRVSPNSANEICAKANINPKANPTRIAHQESEALHKAISDTKLMRPQTDCLSSIGEKQIEAGMRQQFKPDFIAAVSRSPMVYRGNPFQIEAGMVYIKPGEVDDVSMEEQVRVMRFANRVPLLHMGGACAITKAINAVNWRNYGLTQPKGSLPLGPVIIMVHIASVWVPFTSESKEAIAHYPEIIREIGFCLQECGRKLSVFLNKRRHQAEIDRKRQYMTLYIPHLAKGLKDILVLNDKQEKGIIGNLNKILERTHLED